MNTIKILIALLLPLSVAAQKKWHYEQPKIKAYVPSAAFVFAGGIFKELRDASMFYRIKDGGFFDGRNSWKRKFGHLAALVGARTGIEVIARFIVYSFTKNGNRL